MILPAIGYQINLSCIIDYTVASISYSYIASLRCETVSGNIFSHLIFDIIIRKYAKVIVYILSLYTVVYIWHDKTEMLYHPCTLHRYKHKSLILD